MIYISLSPELQENYEARRGRKTSEGGADVKREEGRGGGERQGCRVLGLQELKDDGDPTLPFGPLDLAMN